MIYSQDIETKKERVSQSQELLKKIKELYISADLRHKKFMEDDFIKRRCQKKKKDTEPIIEVKKKKLKTDEKDELDEPKTPEGKINLMKDKKFLNAYQIGDKSIKKKILELEKQLEDETISDEYKNKIIPYICEIKLYNENIKGELLKIKKEIPNDYPEIKKKVLDNYKNFNDEVEDIYKVPKQTGGSLFYYQKYMKYKSKYLQLK